MKKIIEKNQINIANDIPISLMAATSSAKMITYIPMLALLFII